MGVYDILPKGSQVKLWDMSMQIKKVGSKVPDIGIKDYIVLLREGGYVKVKDNKIVKIVEEDKTYYPEDFKVTCVDKWGDVVNSEKDLKGMFGVNDTYYFKDM